MNPLIKKEIRLMLPAWIAAMVLAVAPSLIWRVFWMAKASPDAWESFNYLLSFDVPLMVAFGILCLGIASFGQEFSSNTFAVLLSQPAERRRLWIVKSKVLAYASASVWLVAIILISWQFDSLGAVEHHFADAEFSKGETIAFLTVSALAVCSGGLWTTLLLRQIAGAFWITLLAPLAIVFGMGTVLGFFPISDHAITVVTTAILLCYSIVGFFWAQRLFLRAQDTQWTGGNVLFPWRRRSVEQTASFIRLPRNRFAALVWKEIRLHEASLFVAAVLLVLHLAALVLHPFVTNRNTKMVLELVWSLWLLMPLLIGSAAVAEERKLGVLEAQLCLPAFRRSQFWIKFFVAFVLSVILGAVMPTIIERTNDFGTRWYPYWIFPTAAAVFFISFYASTLARSTLQAIGMAIVLPTVACFGFMGFWFLLFMAFFLYSGSYNYGADENNRRIGLMLGLCLLLFPPLLTRLMFWNFKWLHPGWKIFRFNASTILIAFGLTFVLTNAIYYRPWELLAPLEPPHGPARLNAEAPVKLSIDAEKMTALLPDGRLWEQQIEFYWNAQRWSPVLHSEKLLGGSNWVQSSSGGFYVLGLQRNGSLWCMPQVHNRVRMAQVGSDTDWLQTGTADNGFLLLKKNGTLWLWGTNEPSHTEDRDSAKIRLDLAMAPVRISPETNWTDIIPFAYSQTLAQRRDGTYWGWRAKWFPGGDQTNVWVAETNLDNQWSSYAWGWQSAVEIKTNGELWLFEQIPTNWDRGGLWTYWTAVVPPYTKKIELDSEPVWKAVAFVGYNESLILLRRDGTLWRWNLGGNQPFHPVRLGHYSDWVALPNDNQSGIALAADGSLWSWNDGSDHFWLMPSRRPVYMGNVLKGEGGNE